MANIGDLKVSVSITPERSTVRRCLEILSMYLTDNPEEGLTVREWYDEGIKTRGAYLTKYDESLEQKVPYR